MKKNHYLNLICSSFLVLSIILLGCEKANFDDDYIKANKGSVAIEVPEVKELVFIVTALTNYSDSDPYFTYKKGSYFADVIKHFGKYKNEAIVKKFDAGLSITSDFGFAYQDEAYSYEFDQNNFIKRKENFKSEAFGFTNLLYPYIDELQAFADKTNFRAFYKAHQGLYDAQIKYYRDTANFPKMVDWCNANFPDSRYDAFRILFSPLAYANQSTVLLKNNGFSEPHLHVNFPYLDKKTTKSNDIRRTPYVFTELNHNFENPESEKYEDRIKNIFKDRSKWQDVNNKTTSSYKQPLSNFQEYMNWALVSLWYLDNTTYDADTDLYIKEVEALMSSKGRGFIRFEGFNQEFIRLYKSRNKGETVASLFPKILDWCEKQN